VEVRYHINIFPAECGDTQVFFGWPIAALFAFVAARRIEL